MPPFLDKLIADQLQRQNEAHQRCACADLHGGSGQYLFLSPDGGHHRRSNYARLVFRPACDGRHEATGSRPARVVIADATTWPSIPVAAWPPARAGTSFAPPTGRGIPAIPRQHPAGLLAPGQTRPDSARPQAQP